MKRVCFALTLLIGLGALQLGCGNACDNHRARAMNRYLECGFTYSEDPATASVTCSADEAEYLDCLADCTESASCEALHDEDHEAAVDFSFCRATCKGAGA